MNNTKITVITVCYNAEKFIKETLLSVIGQTYPHIEYIIKDGNSTDNTMKIVRECLKEYSALIFSEPDNGIYDAMNVAASKATGEYIIFMNAGDRFAVSNIIERIVEQIELNNYPDAVYGDTMFLYSNGDVASQKTGAIFQYKFGFLFGGSICHQSFLAKTEFFRKKPFSLEYKICADRDWMISLLEDRCRFLYCNLDISLCRVEGYSLQNIERYEKEVEQCVSQHFGLGKSVWFLMKLLKKNKFLLKLGRKVFFNLSKK